jgi:hypothetical protein
MKRTVLGIFVAACLASPSVLSGQSNASNCQNVAGSAQFILIPAPNDPFGRILGPSTGTLRAAITALVTNLNFLPNGTIDATSVELWVINERDQILFDGRATFTPVPGQPVGTVQDQLKLTVKSGTGVYEGATGTIDVTGTGFNLFGPEAGPGKTYFQVNYNGTICRR